MSARILRTAATGHRPECWCRGTGWRAELGVPCNLPQPTDAEVAYQHRHCRQATARAWSAYLDLALRERLDDGTPILALVFAHDPDLRERFARALSSTPTAPGSADA